VLNPGNLLKLLAAVAQADEEDVFADVLAEDREHIRAGNLAEAGGFNVGGPCDAKAGVVLKVSSRCEPADDSCGYNCKQTKTKKNTAGFAGRTPPGTRSLRMEALARTRIVVLIAHIGRHARRTASLAGRRQHLLRTPEAGAARRIVLPRKRAVLLHRFGFHALSSA
jgi:hypothetical protein